MIKLAIFDFDSTLMDGETIDFLAKEQGALKEVSEITKKAMEGKLDFFESLTKRVKFLEGLKTDKAKEICANLPFIEGAYECIKELKSKNIKVVIFSGGFHFATSKAKEKLNFDGEFANILHSKDGYLTGKVGGEMMFGNSKGKMLKNLQSILGIKKSQTMCVGDGANDISMFNHSKLKIAFCAKPILQNEANVIINTKDLTKILEHI